MLISLFDRLSGRRFLCEIFCLVILFAIYRTYSTYSILTLILIQSAAVTFERTTILTLLTHVGYLNEWS